MGPFQIATRLRERSTGMLAAWYSAMKVADVTTVVSAALPHRRVAVPPATSGRSHGIDWKLTNQGVLLRFTGDRDLMRPLKEVDPNRTQWRFMKDQSGEWWALSLLPLDLLTALGAKVSAPAFALLQHLASRVAQVSRAPEGTFTILGSGYVKLFLSRPWRPKPPIAGIVATRVENIPGKERRFYHLFKASRAALMVAPALKSAGFPVIAESLALATKGVAEPYDAKAAACDPLRDMADATGPNEVKHPIGRAVLHDVMEAMRTGAPAKLALYGYQTVGVGFLKLIGYRGIIGDAPGLGKTAQSLAAIIVDTPTLLPAVVVCPSVVFTNWQDEAAMWLPSVPLWPMPSRKSEGPPPGWRGIVVTTFSLIPYQLDALRKASPRYLIVDEAHRIKNSDTLQSQAVTDLAMEVPHVVLLTGTPIENNVGEIWNLLQAVDTEDYGRKNEFIDDYAETEEVQIGRGRTVKKIVGAKNTDALKHRLQCLMIRRLKEDVAKDLPDLTRQYVRVEPDAGELKEYRKAEEKFGEWVKEELARRIEAGLTAEGIDVDSADVQSEIFAEVQQRAQKATAAEALSRVGYLRQLVGRMKIAHAVDLIVDLVENREPVIVFGVHQEVVWGVAEGLQKAGVKVGVIDGGVSSEDRGRIVREFQGGKIDVIIGSEAMREGVTLTRSHIVMLVEHMWNPAREEQAEGRAHRTGQKNAVIAMYLEIPGTIDTRIHAVIEMKREIVKSVVGSADVSSDVATMAALLESFVDSGAKTKGKRKKNSGIRPPRKKRSHEIRRTEVIAIVFDSKKWTPAQAKSWMRANGFGRRDLFERIQGRLVARLTRGEMARGTSVRVSDGVTVVC